MPAALAPIVGPGIAALPRAAAVTAGGGPHDKFLGLHVTVLRPQTFEKVGRRTRLAAPGTMGGSRVALWPWPADDPLQVAEGIEDALAVSVLTRRPCVAAGSTAAMRRLVVPGGRQTTVYADSDDPGRAAAEALRGRLGLRHCEVLVPEGAKDPAEVLARRAGDAMG
jgi:hypothetical protein